MQTRVEGLHRTRRARVGSVSSWIFIRRRLGDWFRRFCLEIADRSLEFLQDNGCEGHSFHSPGISQSRRGKEISPPNERRCLFSELDWPNFVKSGGGVVRSV